MSNQPAIVATCGSNFVKINYKLFKKNRIYKLYVNVSACRVLVKCRNIDEIFAKISAVSRSLVYQGAQRSLFPHLNELSVPADDYFTTNVIASDSSPANNRHSNSVNYAGRCRRETSARKSRLETMQWQMTMSWNRIWLKGASIPGDALRNPTGTDCSSQLICCAASSSNRQYGEVAGKR